MGKVVGGNAVGLEQHMVDVVLRNGELALYQIVKLELVFDAAGGAEAEHPGFSGIQLSLDLFQGAVTPDGIGAIIAGGFLVGLLLLPHGRKLLLGAEAGIGHALQNQLLGIDMVNVRSLPLMVGTVNAHISIQGCAFIKMNPVVLQGVDQNLHGAGDLPLGVRILHPEEQHAAALVGHTFRGQTLHQVAQMDEAGGGGSHPGDNSPFRKISGGETLLQGLRSIGYMGKQQLR